MSRSKVSNLHDAIGRHIHLGDHVHLGYNEARPNAAVLQLVRSFAGQQPGFTVSSGGLVSAQASLVTEGVANRIIASFVGDNYPTGGPNPAFQRAIDTGKVEIEETSLWTIVARLMGGALGLPFLPVNSLTGSDLAAQEWVRSVISPFGGEDTTVVSSLQPDIVLIHAVAGDENGNLVLSPPYGETAWGALAAQRGVIATVERILPPARMRDYNTLVSLPAHKVIAVCPTPMGAHPYGLFSPIPEVPSYVEDEQFIMDQRAVCRDEGRHKQWVDEWVLGTEDHERYLEHLGRERVAELLGGAATGAWTYVSDPIDADSPPTATETMVVEASRCVVDRVHSNHFEVLMTGIGFANLAAWLAHGALNDGEGPPHLMAEIGAYGYTPRLGDPFIFSLRNLPTCSWMTDVTSILGSIIAGGHGDCLAIVGAGNIDQFGNVNSSRTAEGGFLVGSGGANDIAIGASELIVVVKHGRSRLVEHVPFVTSPGERVRTIVTDRGVMTRNNESEQFVLTKVITGSASLVDSVRSAVEGCGWPLAVAPDVQAVEEPSKAQTQLLRKFDPRSVFLGTR